MDVITHDAIADKIIDVRGQKVIMDSDVAALYGVETKRINEAVKNNRSKFPKGYVLSLRKNEWLEVKSKISTSPLGGGKVKIPAAFTERGLYMLATILKSRKATQTTLAIIDTFAKVREMGRIIETLPAVKQDSPEGQELLHKAGNIISELAVPSELAVNETQATIEFNLAVVKFKYTLKKKR